jgi:hypothetical protein
MEAVDDPDILPPSSETCRARTRGTSGARARRCEVLALRLLPACLYRRAAFLTAGTGESGHQHDEFTELPKLSPERGRDFRLLVRFARVTARAREIVRVDAMHDNATRVVLGAIGGAALRVVSARNSP